MAKTTVEKVQGVIDTDLEMVNIQQYIDTADTFLTTVLTGETVTDAQRIELHTWVTAHLIAVSKERQTISESAGTADLKYTGKYEDGLKMTSYGQTAILLDPTGKLKASDRRVASVTAISEFKEDV